MAEDNKNGVVISRLNRAQGQIKAVARMIEEDRPCEDILIQLRASRAALKAIANGLVEQHLRLCLLDAAEFSSGSQQDEQIEEIMSAIKRTF